MKRIDDETPASMPQQFSGRQYAIEIGREIAEEPEFAHDILVLYRHIFVKDIIKAPVFKERYPQASRKTLMVAVHRAINGYDGKDQAVGGEPYDAVVSKEERKEINKKVRQWNAQTMREADTAKRGWSKKELADLLAWRVLPEYRIPVRGGKTMENIPKLTLMINATHHGGEAIRTEISVNIMIRRKRLAAKKETGVGLDADNPDNVAWTNGEKVFLWEHTQLQEYNSPKRLKNFRKLAQKINEHFHEGKPVRTRNAIGTMLVALRRNPPVRGGSEEETM